MIIFLKEEYMIISSWYTTTLAQFRKSKKQKDKSIKIKIQTKQTSRDLTNCQIGY